MDKCDVHKNNFQIWISQERGYSKELLNNPFLLRNPEDSNILALGKSDTFPEEKKNAIELLTMTKCFESSSIWLEMKWYWFSKRFNIGTWLSLYILQPIRFSPLTFQLKLDFAWEENAKVFLLLVLSAPNCFSNLLSYISDYRWCIMSFHSELD